MSERRPEVHIMLDFMQAQSRLPRAIQSKTSKLILQLKADPSANGVNWESIEGAQDRHMKSARVDLSYRAIVYDRGNALVLLWVDKHDDAYRWARNRVVEINPATASVQVSDLGLVEVAQERAAEASEPDRKSPKLFDHMVDADLLKLGVPEALLPAVRTFKDDTALESAKDGIPADAYDALVCLAAGYTVLETEAVGPRQARARAGRRLRRGAQDGRKPPHVLVGRERRRASSHARRAAGVLARFPPPVAAQACRADLERPRPRQGRRGSGKTVVAMHRARWLSDLLGTRNDPNGKVLFTTFTSNLAADVEDNLANLCSKEQLARIEVKHLDGWVVEFLKRAGYDKEIVYLDDEGNLEEAWSQAYNSFGEGLGLSLHFLKDEWRQIVQANAISSLPDYLRAQRTGRGTPIDRKTKEKVWAVFAAYRARLDQEGWSEPDDAYRDTREILREKPALLPYRAVVVDEAQDLGAEALKLIAAIAPKAADKPAQDSLFIVGDAHQRIYGRKASMTKCGIDIRGRSRKLKVCYRTSDEIRRWAVGCFRASWSTTWTTRPTT